MIPPDAAGAAGAAGAASPAWDGAAVDGDGDGEAALVERARAGDGAAFGQLYERHHADLLRYVSRLAKASGADAEALTHDAWVKAWVNVGCTAPGLRFAPWLFRIATNVYRDDWRYRHVRPAEVAWVAGEAGHVVASDDPADDPEGATLAKEDAAAVGAALRRIPANYRRCLVLREYRGLSYDEIGAALTLTRAVVKSQLHRARKALRRALADPAAFGPRAPRPPCPRRPRVPPAALPPVDWGPRRRALGLTQAELLREAGYWLRSPTWAPTWYGEAERHARPVGAVGRVRVEAALARFEARRARAAAGRAAQQGHHQDTEEVAA